MKKNAFLIIIAFLMSISCAKDEPTEPEPIACFTVSSSYVDINQVITVSNCSGNAFSYKWDDGDGTIKTSSVPPQFYYSTPGTYTVSLTVYSKSGNKQDIAQESITVIHKTGNVTFWQSGTPSYDVTAVVINDAAKYITLDAPSGVPDCITNGCANFTLPTGTYSYGASDGNHNWSGSITILADKCVKLQLQ